MNEFMFMYLGISKDELKAGNYAVFGIGDLIHTYFSVPCNSVASKCQLISVA